MKNKKSGTEERKAVKAYPVRFTPEQYEAVTEKANDCGLSLAEYIRRCALGRQTRSKIDSQIINELRKLGGLQKHLFNEEGGRHGDEYAAVLRVITATIQRIGGGEK